MLTSYNLSQLPERAPTQSIPDLMYAIQDTSIPGFVMRDVSIEEVQSIADEGMEAARLTPQTEEPRRLTVVAASWLDKQIRLGGNILWGPIPGAPKFDAPLHVDSAPHHPLRIRFHYTEEGSAEAKLFETCPTSYPNFVKSVSDRGGAMARKKALRALKKGMVDDRFLNPEGFSVSTSSGTLLVFRVGGPAVAHAFRTVDSPRKITMISAERSD